MRTASAATLAALALAFAVAGSASDGPARAAAPVEAEGVEGRTALDTGWTVRVQNGDRAGRNWTRGAFSGARVTVPHVPNARRITGRRGLIAFRGAVAWYRTTVTVDRAGVWALRFGSVHHRATVWVDGRRVASHVGVYLPFDARFAARPGRHVVVVRADWRGPAAQKRAGWHRTWFNFGGINREVTLRRLAASDLAPPAVRTRLASDGAALVDVTARVRNMGPTRSVAVRGALRNGSDLVGFTFPAVRVPRDGWRRVRTRVRVPRPALWAPGSPNLYDLIVEVVGESRWTGRTGLRELTWGGGVLRVNGRRVILKGASLHEDVRGRGDALTAADMDALVANLRAIGANATRAQHQLSPALVARLDAAGIMLWQGVGPVDAPGAWTNETPAERRRARARVRQSVDQLQHHPSVITWNLANEVAGNGHPKGQPAFVAAMARELHRTDPGRPVALDVWGAHPPKRMGPMYRDIDLIGATNYVGWYESPLARRSTVAYLVRRRVAKFRRVFAGKVLVITEFGAEASGANRTGSPGGYRFQTQLLATHLRAYRADRRLSGMLVWALRDFAVNPAFRGGSIRELVPGIRIVAGLNQKGLYTHGNRPKPAAGVVARVFTALGPFGTG